MRLKEPKKNWRRTGKFNSLILDTDNVQKLSNQPGEFHLAGCFLYVFVSGCANKFKDIDYNYLKLDKIGQKWYNKI